MLYVISVYSIEILYSTKVGGRKFWQVSVQNTYLVEKILEDWLVCACSIVKS